MSSDIVTLLHLDKDLFSSEVTLVKEVNGCDSSFVISSLIGHQIKSRLPTLLITCHNSLTHYQNVGFKMNYSLKRNIESNQVVFYDLGRDIVDQLLKGKSLTLPEVLSKLKNLVSVFGQDNFYIIFEGASHLFDLQYSFLEINGFLKKLIVFGRQSNSNVLIQCNIANEVDATCILSNALSHMAHIVVEVVNLPTGLSADVSGHVIVKKIGQKFQAEYKSILNIKPTMYHFKLFDKGVKLFAPGIV